MSLRINNSSVLSCLIGIAFLMTGFVGFMAHSFSKSTAELDGIRLVNTSHIDRQLQSGEKVCIVSTINADDTFEMPDTRQKAIKGRLYLCAVWPDSSQNVLIDWNRKSKYVRIPDGGGDTPLYITPRNFECANDTSTLPKLKIIKAHISIEIRYFQYKFNLGGIQSKGEPKIVLQREYLADSAKVALTLTKTNTRSTEQTIEVINVVPYDLAKSRNKILSNSKTVYIIIGVIGILMFFIPERQAINTIESTKNIVNKIINH